MRFAPASLRCAVSRRLTGARGVADAVGDFVSPAERRHLEQPLPPRALLARLRSVAPDRREGSKAGKAEKEEKEEEGEGEGGEEEDEGVSVPGDSFGIMRNRVAFYRPLPRQSPAGPLGECFPAGCHPLRCVRAATLRLLCARHGVGLRDAVGAMRDAQLDVNAAVQLLAQRKGFEPSYGSFGLVALESYAPETYCLVSFNLPSFEATRCDDVLDAIHELTLSAAELPLDIPPQDVVSRFVNHWTIEDGTRVRDVLASYDITVKQILHLPFGDYSAQGFYVLHPVKEDTPNIGTGAAACCLDLRTGIHNRFRFHVERVADSISEHVVRELVHYDQGVHLFRQPYWFRPEYSVEEFMRFKESLLQPSASVFEMRYAVVTAPMYGHEGYRNLIEMEKLKVAQHKYEKHYEDFTAPGKWLTSDNAQLQTVVAGGGGSNAPGSAMHMHTNSPGTSETAMETRTGPLRQLFEGSIQAHGDRVFSRFYRNNFH